MALLLFGRGRGYDRERSMALATRARSRGRRRKAIHHYREVLVHEPANAEIHRRVAPLLAAGGEREAAWQSYRVAVRGLERRGFLSQAVGLLREAAAELAGLRPVWEEISRIELLRSRRADAHRALWKGSLAFRSRAGRADAIQLLLAARRLDPLHFPANFALARLLARSGAREPADRILEGLAGHCSGRLLRRARGAQLRISPSPRRLWRWLRACFGLR